MLNLKVKSLLTYILASTLFVIISLTVSAKSTLNEELRTYEKELHTAPDSTHKKLINFEFQLASASTKDKIFWFILLSQSSVLVQDTETKEYLSKKVSTITSGLNQNEKMLWQQLLELHSALLKDTSKNVIPLMGSMEDKITQQDDSFLTAYFYRTFYYAHVLQGVYDVAMDLAIKNQKQWQQIYEPYFSLEMAFRLLEFRVGMLNDPDSDNIIASFIEEEKRLGSTRYEIPLAELKANQLSRLDDLHEANKQLLQLINNNKIDNKSSRYPFIIHMLAVNSSRLEQHELAKEYANTVLNDDKYRNDRRFTSLKVILAKSLVYLGQFEQAKEIIAELDRLYHKDNDLNGLIELDYVNISLFYKTNDLEGLFKTTNQMINKLNQFQPRSEGGRMFQRAQRAVEADEQKEVAQRLEKNNQAQQQQISYSNRLLAVKNQYLMIMFVFCAVLVSLFFWLYYLLKKVRRLANTDSLTGVRNRRSGLEKTEKLLMQARQNRQQTEIAIAMMDLDNFKQINDTYGHDVGDKVIKLAVKKTQEQLEEQDIICRMGGEEFLIVLNKKNHQQIAKTIEAIREQINQGDVASLGIDKPISASIGLTELTSTANFKPLNEYLVDADTALYKAKDCGRNQVQYFANVS